MFNQLFNIFLLVARSGNEFGGADDVFDNWSDTITGTIWAFVQRLLAPVGILACLVMIVFNVIKIISMRNNGMHEGYDKNITAIVICVIAAVLLSTVTSWGSLFQF